MSNKDWRCTKCGESLWETMMFAALIDLGCGCSWDPSRCFDGSKHNFAPPKTIEADQRGAPPEVQE